MEVINNMAAAAAKVVWGEPQVAQKPSTAEPVSGKQGDVSKGEPYDAGNIEPQPPIEELKTPTIETPALNAAPPMDDTALAPQPIAAAGANPSSELLGDNLLKSVPEPTNEPTERSETSAEKTEHSETSAAKTQPSSAEPGDNTHAQIDTRAPEDAPEDTLSPDKLNGPGPRPVEALAKERGGDAGAVGENKPATDSSLPKPDSGVSLNTQENERENGSASQPDDKDADKPGPGETVIKTTGLHADGGNFDASAAGAGREAERLLEEKGIHHVPGAKDEGHDSSDSIDRSSNASGGSGEKKPKLLKRLKAKLPHHHHHHHHKKHEA